MGHDELLAEARDRGKAAGSWVIDGNTTRETAQHIVSGYEDGDPAVLDIAPAPLSGEWAGESMTELRLDDADDETLTAYEDAYGEAFWDEVLTSARRVLETDREPNCDDDGHDFGPVTESRMGGAFVQYCQRPGCRVVCALADDEES